MNLRQIVFFGAVALPLMGQGAFAQNMIAPLPESDGSMQRITPVDNNAKTDNLLSTRPVAAQAPAAIEPSAVPPLVAPTPTLIPPKSAAPAPFARPALVAPSKPGAPMSAAAPALPMKSPFGRATPTGPEVPSAPHDVVATPVVNVDEVEVSEPAPPTPVAAGADPVAEDPAEPTEFTSPMFDNATDNGGPRKIVLRVLNKVTAQSSLYKAKPGETIKFGRLEVIAEMCRISTPNSPTDYAALVDIKEYLPGKEGVKALYHGWMYASSPSISGLEHPIYDVTMVSCETAAPAPKEDTKSAKKADKSKKK